MQLIRSLWLLLLVTGFSQSQSYASSEASVLPQQDSFTTLLQHNSEWVQHTESHDDHDATITSVQPQLVTCLYGEAPPASAFELAAVHNANPARAPPVLSC